MKATTILSAALAVALFPVASEAGEIFKRDNFTFLNILPCMPGKEEVVAKDAIEYAERTGHPYVLYSLTLQPQGRPAMKTVDVCVESYKRFAKLLEGTKAKPAILLQAIIGHWTQDRAEKEVEPWQRAINYKGEITRHCPLDPNYRDYIRTVGRKLAECRPALILGDDDIRSFSPDAECFCPLHTAEYNRRTGRSLTPDEYRALIANADWRSPEHKAFTDLQRDTIAGVCKLIREGIDSVDPSIPAGVCQPGWVWSQRDIPDYAEAIASKTQIPFLRLGNGIYTESTPKQEIAYNTLKTLSEIERLGPRGVLLFDEADTYPHNLFSKSSVAFHAKLAVGAFAGLTGAKAWYVNGHKGDVPVSRHYTDILAAHRGQYDALAAASASSVPAGVLIPSHPEFPCESAAKRQGIRPTDARNWGDTVFGNFGIPFAATFDFGRDGIYAIAGADAVRRFSDEQLKAMLAKRVLLDGKAAAALVKRGFGEYLGVSLRTDEPLFTGDYDEVRHRHMAYPKRVKPTLFTADPAAKVVSTLVWRESSVAKDFERVSPSGVIFRNKAGGLVATLSYHFDMSCTYMYTEARKDYIAGVLAELNGGVFDNVCGNAQNVMALARRDREGRDLLFYENLNYDPENHVAIRRAAKPASVEEMDDHGVWRSAGFSYADGQVTVPGAWACEGVRVFRIK